MASGFPSPRAARRRKTRVSCGPHAISSPRPVTRPQASSAFRTNPTKIAPNLLERPKPCETPAPLRASRGEAYARRSEWSKPLLIRAQQAQVHGLELELELDKEPAGMRTGGRQPATSPRTHFRNRAYKHHPIKCFWGQRIILMHTKYMLAVSPALPKSKFHDGATSCTL